MYKNQEIEISTLEVSEVEQYEFYRNFALTSDCIQVIGCIRATEVRSNKV